MPAQKHLHKYKRTTIGKNYVVMHCIKPDCTHYLPIKMVIGKMCECNRCEGPMLMTRAAVTLALPHCESCTVRKEVDMDGLLEKLKKLGI